MRKSFVSLIAGVVGVVYLLTGSLAYASSAAAPAPAPAASAGQGLEISPPVIELTADPGQTITTQIRVRNVTQAELIAKGEADDFGASTDETGTPKILTDETGVTRYSLKYWIASVPDLDLAPQELKTTTISINVPSNAEPGGHYAVVRFTAVPISVNGFCVSLAASVGSLILLRVNGAVTDSLNIAQFSAGNENSNNLWVANTMFQHGPVSFLVRLQNTGTVHEQPKGTITVRSSFGGIPETLQVNPDGGNILPDSIRRFVSTDSQKALFGHYTATLALTYAGNKPINAMISFWVIPWELILLVLVGLAVLVYLFKIGIRKYNEHIIAIARRR